MGIDKEVAKIKLVRRRILSFLNMMDPAPLLLGMIYDNMTYIYPTYDFTLFEKDIMYFRRKGWLDFVNEKIVGEAEFRQKAVLLTASGKEIAERTQTDTALEI